MGVEVCAVFGDAVFHDLDPLVFVIVEEGNDGLFQFIIDAVGVFVVAFFDGEVVVIGGVANRPAGNAFAFADGFGPPAINGAERGDAI